jgi:hypothetical protein
MVFRTDLEHRRQHSAATTPELHGHGHREVWLPETLDDDDAYSSMRNSAIVIALHRICALGVCCGREDPSPHFGTEAEFRLDRAVGSLVELQLRRVGTSKWLAHLSAASTLGHSFLHRP